MQDNKLIALIVVVLHIKDAILSKKSKMSYSHPPYKFRYPQFIRNRASAPHCAKMKVNEKKLSKCQFHFPRLLVACPKLKK